LKAPRALKDRYLQSGAAVLDPQEGQRREAVRVDEARGQVPEPENPRREGHFRCTCACVMRNLVG
jgi:hypothetical protein